MKTKDTKTLGK